MKIQIDFKSLVKVLKMIKKVSLNNKHVDFNKLKVKVNRESIELSKYNEKGDYVNVKVSCVSDGVSDEFLIEEERFHDSLMLSNDNVIFVDDTMLKFDLFSFTIETAYNAYRQPKFGGKFFEIQTEDLLRMFDETLYACSNDETRTALTCCEFIIDHDNIVCHATDGYRLSKSTLNGIKSSFTGTYLFNGDSMEVLSRSIKNSKDKIVKVVREDSGSGLYFVFNGKDFVVLFYSPIINVEFPRVEGFFEKKTEDFIEVKTKASVLLNSFKRAKVFVKNKNNLVRLIVQYNTIIIGDEQHKEYAEKLIVETNHFNCDSVNIGMNVNYMIECLESISSEETVILYVVAPKRPFGIKTNTLHSVIMPMLIDNDKRVW